MAPLQLIGLLIARPNFSSDGPVGAQVNEDERDVIPAVVVRTAVIGDPPGRFLQTETFLTSIMDLFGNLLLRVDKDQAVRAQNEHFVIVLDLPMVALRLRNQELLVRLVSNSSTDRYLPIDPRDPILAGDQPIFINNPLLFICPFGILIDRKLLNIA